MAIILLRRRGPARGGHRRTAIGLAVADAVVAVGALTIALGGPSSLVSGGGPAGLAPAPPPVRVTLSAGGTHLDLGPAAGAPDAAPAGQGGAPGPVSPTAPVTVAATEGTLRAVTLTDARTGHPVPGTLGADGHSWHTGAPLGYRGSYRLAVTAVGADQREVHETATLATVAPATLAATSFIPAPTVHDVGVGQPLVVRFNHPIQDRPAAERSLTVTSDPQQPGAWFWMSATEAHYRPAEYWKPGSTVTLKADTFGVDLGGGTYGEEDRVDVVHVHDSWVAQADGASHQMKVLHNGQLVRTLPISLGSPKNPLPRGHARDLRQAAQHHHGLLHVRGLRGPAGLLQGEGRPRPADLQRR